MLSLALRRLRDDAGCGRRLGDAARRYWAADARSSVMARDYEAALARAARGAGAAAARAAGRRT